LRKEIAFDLTTRIRVIGMTVAVCKDPPPPPDSSHGMESKFGLKILLPPGA